MGLGFFYVGEYSPSVTACPARSAATTGSPESRSPPPPSLRHTLSLVSTYRHIPLNIAVLSASRNVRYDLRRYFASNSGQHKLPRYLSIGGRKGPDESPSPPNSADYQAKSTSSHCSPHKNHPHRLEITHI